MYTSRTGSSPHARGLRSSSSRRPKAAGIIPARAGFTALSPPTPARASDHPRTRGVYARHGATSGNGLGSSPHARGLRAGLEVDLLLPGIIPARAGFTPETGSSAGQCADHPRTRGVYVDPA